MPDRVRRGAPNARFMPGLFAPYPGAGPGSIWKISGTNGAISLFANVTLDGTGNSGPALGGLAFDPASRRIYVADRGTGTIHSFDLQGVDTGRFDHGTQALPLVGLPSVPFDPRHRLDIRSPAFDSGDPATWGYAPPARRVFGLAVHRGRLYYAVAAGPAVWSVSLEPDGSFGVDPRVEIAFQVGPVPVAENLENPVRRCGRHAARRARDADRRVRFRRAGQAGYRPGAAAQGAASRRRRHAFLLAGGRRIRDRLCADHRNGDGGIALGSGYDRDGVADPGECGGTLWITGSQLRTTAIRRGATARGELCIDGLQEARSRASSAEHAARSSCSSTSTTQPIAPARAGPAAIGHAWSHGRRGGLAHVSGSAVAATGGASVRGAVCPAGFYDSRNQCLPAPCAPGELYRGGVCEKPECRPGERVRDGSCCPADSKWNPRTRTCNSKPPDRPDLAIKKEVAQCAPHDGPCTFRIVVTNDSDVPYTGPILVGDTINPGAIQSMTGPPGWTCGPVSGAISACIDLDATLGPRQSVEFKRDRGRSGIGAAAGSVAQASRAMPARMRATATTSPASRAQRHAGGAGRA